MKEEEENEREQKGKKKENWKKIVKDEQRSWVIDMKSQTMASCVCLLNISII